MESIISITHIGPCRAVPGFGDKSNDHKSMKPVKIVLTTFCDTLN